MTGAWEFFLLASFGGVCGLVGFGAGISEGREIEGRRCRAEHWDWEPLIQVDER